MFNSKQSEKLNDLLFKMKLNFDKSYFKCVESKHEFMFINAIDIYQKSFPEETKDGVKATQISKCLGITKPAVSKMLNSLEEKELIERSYSQKDRRVVYINIAAKGNLFLENAKNHAENLCNKITEEMGEKDTEEFIRLMKMMIGIIEKTKDNNSNNVN